MKEEFFNLLNNYWKVASESYEAIKAYRDTPEYTREGVIPSKEFTYEQHGLGFKIILDSGLWFDFDFSVDDEVSGFKPYFVYRYMEQVKGKYPQLSHITIDQIVEILEGFVKEGIMQKSPIEQLYNWTERHYNFTKGYQ